MWMDIQYLQMFYSFYRIVASLEDDVYVLWIDVSFAFSISSDSTQHSLNAILCSEWWMGALVRY